MTVCEELEELIPAFVLDAVSDDERARIEAHLSGCDRCKRLAAEYRPVADWLAHAAPRVEPSAELRRRVLAAFPGTQTIQPLHSAFWTPLAAGLANLFRPPAFSALALVLIVALGVWNLALQDQLTQQAAGARQMLDELSQQRDFLTMIAYSDGQPHHLQGTVVASQSAGRLYGAPDENTFVLVVYLMPPLPPDRVYQLWLIDAQGQRTSGGTFTIDGQGQGWMLVHAPKPLSQYQQVGITVEPAGGSPEPTGAKMLGGTL